MAYFLAEYKIPGCDPNALLTSESCDEKLENKLFHERWKSAPAQFSRKQKASGCDLVNAIYNQSPAELAEQFNTKSPYNYPSLLISEDKLKQQNNDIFKLQTDSKPVVVNRNPACVEPFNIRQLNDATNLQAGYARNIDLDSELRRINHLQDRCYYDNYKLHPNEAPVGNGLNCHKATIVKDYTKVGRAECTLPYPGVQYLSAITPPHDQKPYADKCGLFTNNVQYGELTRPDYPTDNVDLRYYGCRSKPAMPQYCIDMKVNATKCNTAELKALDENSKRLMEYKESIGGLVPEYYQFNGSTTDSTAKLTRNYPCQRMFNNFTKRSTLPNLLNTFDINPKCL